MLRSFFDQEIAINDYKPFSKIYSAKIISINFRSTFKTLILAIWNRHLKKLWKTEKCVLFFALAVKKFCECNR